MCYHDGMMWALLSNCGFTKLLRLYVPVPIRTDKETSCAPRPWLYSSGDKSRLYGVFFGNELMPWLWLNAASVLS